MNLSIKQLGGRQLNFMSAYFLAIFIALIVSYFSSLAYTGKQYIFWIFCISAYCMLGYGIFQKNLLAFLFCVSFCGFDIGLKAFRIFCSIILFVSQWDTSRFPLSSGTNFI